jgi:hypothetical protein
VWCGVHVNNPGGRPRKAFSDFCCGEVEILAPRTLFFMGVMDFDGRVLVHLTAQNVPVSYHR